MKPALFIRNDLITIINQARFKLRHYAHGVYPVCGMHAAKIPVNRMFFPLKNPGGSQNYIQDKTRKVEFRPGKLYFIPAYYPVRMVLDDRLEFLSLQSNLEIFPGIELFSGCRRFLELTAPPEKERLLEICHSTGDPFLSAVQAGALTMNILAKILLLFRPEEFWEPLTLKQYAGLMDFLEKHGNARTSVSDLAALQGVSRECFSRHFTKSTGLTPKQLIDRFIVSRALTLIYEGKNCKEISSLLQFSNEFVFSRYIKRNTGISPRNWKEKQYLEC